MIFTFISFILKSIILFHKTLFSFIHDVFLYSFNIRLKNTRKPKIAHEPNRIRCTRLEWWFTYFLIIFNGELFAKEWNWRFAQLLGFLDLFGSLCVPIKFPMGYQHVSQVFNVFPHNMFPIATHSVPYALPNVVLVKPIGVSILWFVCFFKCLE